MIELNLSIQSTKNQSRALFLAMFVGIIYYYTGVMDNSVRLNSSFFEFKELTILSCIVKAIRIFFSLNVISHCQKVFGDIILEIGEIC